MIENTQTIQLHLHFRCEQCSVSHGKRSSALHGGWACIRAFIWVLKIRPSDHWRMAVPDRMVRVHHIEPVDHDVASFVDKVARNAIVQLKKDSFPIEWFGVEAICSRNHGSDNQRAIRVVGLADSANEVSEAALPFFQRMGASNDAIRFM